MVSAKKRSLNAKVDLPFDDFCAYFCIYAFPTFPKCILGWKPTISKQAVLPTVQIRTRTHYLPYTSTYVLESYSIGFYSSRRPEYSPY